MDLETGYDAYSGVAAGYLLSRQVRTQRFK
jgi:hypothetical protein